MKTLNENLRVLPAFVTVRDVAELFGVKPRTVYDWVDRGLLPAHRIGRRLIRFTPGDVEELLRRSKRGQ